MLAIQSSLYISGSLSCNSYSGREVNNCWDHHIACRNLESVDSDGKQARHCGQLTSAVSEKLFLLRRSSLEEH